jgi:hypothetical protein
MIYKFKFSNFGSFTDAKFDEVKALIPDLYWYLERDSEHQHVCFVCTVEPTADQKVIAETFAASKGYDYSYVEE